MLNAAALRFQVRTSGIGCFCERGFSVTSAGRRRCLSPRNRLQFIPLAHQSADSGSLEPSTLPGLNFTIGSSSGLLQNYHWGVKDRRIHTLFFLSCAAAISATWLCFSLIPTLLAFKRAAESTKKLTAVMKEEIPGTIMAARLSGMEISDLSMKLTDLSQELTPGIRHSTQAVRLGKGRLTRSTPIEAAPNENGIPEPNVAKTARVAREGIVKGRAAVQIFFSFTQFSKMLLNSFRAKQ